MSSRPYGPPATMKYVAAIIGSTVILRTPRVFAVLTFKSARSCALCLCERGLDERRFVDAGRLALGRDQIPLASRRQDHDSDNQHEEDAAARVGIRRICERAGVCEEPERRINREHLLPSGRERRD